MNREQQEAFYNEIVRIYDYVDGIIDAIGQEPEEIQAVKLQHAQPIIEQMQETAEILAESYLHFVQEGKVTRKELQDVRTAIRRVYVNIQNYVNELDNMTVH